MKTILIGIFALLFTAGICRAQKEVSKEEVTKQMQEVGALHNATLDGIYNSLKKDLGPLDKNVGNPEKIKYLNGLIPSSLPFNPIPGALADIRENASNQSGQFMLKSLERNETRAYSEIAIEASKLSSVEKEFYTRLNAIIDKYGEDLPALKTAIADYNESVYKKFGTSSNSTLALLAGSSVAEASANYWYVNAERWKQLKSGSASKVGADPCGKKILKADAAGAVTGAIGGAVVGAGAAGVGAIPGAVAGATGGAVTGSASSAVTCLLDYFWP